MAPCKDPDNCPLLEGEREKREVERVKREYYEEEAAAYRDAIQGLVRRIFGRRKEDGEFGAYLNKFTKENPNG